MQSTFTRSEEQLLLGTLLGDGNLRPTTKSARTWVLTIRHGWIQHEYNSAKYRILSESGALPPYKQKNGGYGEWSSLLRTTSLAALERLGRLCYKQQADGRWKKTVTQEWLDQLDWEGVAWWVGDDGSLSPGLSITLHTEGFPHEQVELLVDWLNAREVECRIQPVRGSTTGKLYFRIRCTVAGTRALVAKIAPYVPEPMRYKIAIPPVLDRVRCSECGTDFKPSQRLQNAIWRKPGRKVRCYRPECNSSCQRARWFAAKSPEEQAATLERIAKRDDPAWTPTVAAREYRAANRERILAYRREWRAKRKAAQAPKSFTCARCGVTGPRTARSGLQKYCAACKPLVRQEHTARAVKQHQEWSAAQPPTRARACSWCQKEIQVARGSRQEFCSLDCRDQAANKRRRNRSAATAETRREALASRFTTRACQGCGATIQVPGGKRTRFCSISCRVRASNQRQWAKSKAATSSGSSTSESSPSTTSRPTGTTPS